MGADPNTSAAIAAQANQGGDSMAADATTKPTDEAPAPVVAATAEVAAVSPPAPVDRTDEILARFDALNKKVEDMEKLKAARDERPAAPAVHVVEHAPPSAEVIQASFALQGGLPGVEKQYDAKTLEAAHKARGQITLGEVIVQAAVANGYDGPQRIRSGTLRPILTAAWATHAISDLLANVANKFLLGGFTSVESSWRSISTTGPLNDLKTYTRYRLNGAFTFEKVANGGEIKNAEASDEKRTISADTYAIMTSVTRTDLINDDLGALTSIPQRIGRGGALSLNDVFWTEFQSDHSNWYTAARGNLVSTAGALTITNLKKLQTAFKKLKDKDGKPLALNPAILLVPSDLELDAAEIMGSSLVQATGSTDARVPERNVLAGRYRVVDTAYLTNVDDYYLVANPADMPAMEVGFLDGQQSPIVETAEADFNKLGVQMRGFFDFGVAKAEYLASVKGDKA
jgi:phage major head subunit gpT-like protein